MTDMTAFEQQVAGEMVRRAGPVRPVGDAAIFNDITAASRSQRWRFSMFSALRFVAAGAIVALLGGFLLSGVLTTQQGDLAAPAAETTDPEVVAALEEEPHLWPVTGRTVDVSLDPAGAGWWCVDCNGGLRDFGSVHTVEWSDPRLPGEVAGLLGITNYSGDEDYQAPYFPAIHGQVLLEGPDGYWNGTLHLHYDMDSVSHGWMTLTGHDAYENLFAWFRTTNEGACYECLTLTGAIYGGRDGHPPMPEPLVPSTE